MSLILNKTLKALQDLSEKVYELVSFVFKNMKRSLRITNEPFLVTSNEKNISTYN